jgi:acetamidase/formamidase
MQAVISNRIYRIDPSYEPCAKVRLGEVFTVSLQNAFGKSFKTVEEFEQFMSVDNEEEKRKLNHPCTGPIEVITDQVDISLAINILDFKIACGFQCISKSTGILKDIFSQRECIIYTPESDGTLQFHNNDLRMHGSPKLGFIATIDDKVKSCGRASASGGNLDFNFLDKGSTIYLPVNYVKPLLLIGDLHICQGNGEAAGIAVEADGEITLKITAVDKIDFPVINHKNFLVIVGWGDSLEEALKTSVENAIVYLRRIFPFCDWSDGEIYKFISAEGNLTAGNTTGHTKTFGVVFVKQRVSNKFSFPVF